MNRPLNRLLPTTQPQSPSCLPLLHPPIRNPTQHFCSPKHFIYYHLAADEDWSINLSLYSRPPKQKKKKKNSCRVVPVASSNEHTHFVTLSLLIEPASFPSYPLALNTVTSASHLITVSLVHLGRPKAFFPNHPTTQLRKLNPTQPFDASAIAASVNERTLCALPWISPFPLLLHLHFNGHTQLVDDCIIAPPNPPRSLSPFGDPRPLPPSRSLHLDQTHCDSSIFSLTNVWVSTRSDPKLATPFARTSSATFDALPPTFARPRAKNEKGRCDWELHG